jgi:hypothetical protein
MTQITLAVFIVTWPVVLPMPGCVSAVVHLIATTCAKWRRDGLPIL